MARYGDNDAIRINSVIESVMVELKLFTDSDTGVIADCVREELDDLFSSGLVGIEAISRDRLIIWVSGDAYFGVRMRSQKLEKLLRTKGYTIAIQIKRR